MRKLSIFSIGLLLTLQAIGASAIAPRIFYTDLTSGPNTGGKDNNGVFLTIYGKGFGVGTSTVTVGGGEVYDYISWSDDMIEVQLGSAASTGDVIVTTADGTSNDMTFNVRSGNIYFVDDTSPNDPGLGTYGDPWRSPASFYDNMVPGDTCYFRQGTYPGIYGYGGIPWKTQVVILPQKGGTAGNPIAFVGYPGETATFDADGETSPRINFSTYDLLDGNRTEYIVVAKLRLIAYTISMRTGDNWRVVGNYCDGIHTPISGAIIVPWGDNTKILGNELTGGTSGNKLDHAIYPKWGEDMEIAWNYIHNNNFDRGPMISINHDDAQTLGKVFKNYHIHDNIIDVTTYPSRAIGIAECADGSSFYIYNNLIIGGPAGSSPSIYAHSSEVHIWNNSIYDTGGSNGGTISILRASVDYLAYPVSIRNNIIYTETGSGYIYVQPDVGIPAPTVDSNCYYGTGSYTRGDDANMINADPKYVNPPGDLSLQDTSPCINAGSSDVSSVVTKDFDGLSRPLGADYDIGAYEYEGDPTMVVLSSFTAMTEDGKVILVWRTEVEIDNVGFAIYRSDTRNGNYTRIAFIHGAEDSETSNDYQFTDEAVRPGHTYYYYLEDVDVAGKRSKSDVIQVSLHALPRHTELEILPEQNSLFDNYPNPSNPETWIPYNLAEAADVNIQIYDVRGHLIRTLHLGHQPARFYLDKDKAAYWDGRDNTGERVASGVYFYHVSAGNFSAVRKMVILR